MSSDAELERLLEQQGVEPNVRILFCYECKTQEVMPDYPPDGDPQKDATLHYVDEKHGGRTQQPHHRTVVRMPTRVFEDRPALRQVTQRVWKETTGFTPSYYAMKDNLLEDAVKCHIAHQRQIPCIDYRDSTKKLTPPTMNDRRALAKELRTQRNKFDLERLEHAATNTYLCDFCPVKVAVDHAKRVARGEA